MKKEIKPDDHIVVFSDHKIRRIFHENAWWFSVIDVVQVLTESVNSRDYWYKMKVRVRAEEGSELSTLCRQLRLQAPDGKMRETDCANTEGLFRVIQSIPSPRAEPFKRWLAKVGYERIQEIEDPELAQERAREIYKAKGYDDAWVEKRMRGIQVRAELTNEWNGRDVGGAKEYAILTAEIAKATFGMTPTEYKQHKGLERENLRDHMSDLELIFSMLGEASATEITREKDAQGFDQNKSAAQEGGEVAGSARKDLEARTGKRVITNQNYLELAQKQIKSEIVDE